MKKFLFVIFLIMSSPAWAMMESAIEDVQAGRHLAAYEKFKHMSSYGLPDADYWLGRLYLEGLGVERDVKQAMTWLHRAARQDHAGAMSVLGRIHLEGLTGTQNFNLARGWFNKAAKQGDVYALMTLGEMYMSGIGITMSKTIGMKYVREAARKGSPQGQHISGMAHLKGIGVKKDLRQARFWLEKAAAQNFLPSIEALNELGGTVNQPLTSER